MELNKDMGLKVKTSITLCSRQEMGVGPFHKIPRH